MNIRNCPCQVICSFNPFNLKSKRIFFTERTIKIKTGGLKSRIDTCRKDCASLKERFNTRLGVDTNLQVKEIKGGVQQTGACFRVC